MPQSATLESTTTPFTIPAPRTEQPQDPNAWAAELSHSELILALALSDMPRTIATIDQTLGGYIRPRPAPSRCELTPSGKRTLNAWAVQGIERAGGMRALWQDASRLLEFNLTETWDTNEGKAFTKRFGGVRRMGIARHMVWDAATAFTPVKVRIRVTATTESVVRELGRRYPLDTAIHQGPYEAVYTMRRHHAHLVAHALGLGLVNHVQGGYALV